MTAISNSERKTAACAQRWLFGHGLLLEAGEPSSAMRTGSFVHVGLEHMLGQPTELEDALAAIDKAESDEIGGGSGDPMYIDPFAPIVPVERIQEDAEMARQLVRRYAEHYGPAGGWRTVFTEQKLATRVRVPKTSNKSRTTTIVGTLDRVVEINGQYWLVEHKTTTKDIWSWIDENHYSPQATTYAVLAMDVLGIKLEGVIYDIIRRDLPAPAESLAVLKDGSRLAKPSRGLPATNAVEFLRAVELLGQDLDSVDWYRDVYDKLKRRESQGHYFHRHVDNFDDNEIRRAEVELYYSATRLRQWHDKAAPYREWIHAAQSVAERNEAIRITMEAIGNEFDRNPAQCMAYFRECEFMSACKQRSFQDLRLGKDRYGDVDLHTNRPKGDK